MKENREFTFEVLIVDKDGKSQITTESSLLHALIGSDTLWRKPSITNKSISDTEMGLKIRILVVDTNSVLTDLVESAFILEVASESFDSLESFRKPLLVFLKNRLAFSNIRILKDEISTKIANEIYPLINNVENKLRRFIALFFTQKIGIDWFGLTVPSSIKTKIQNRKGNEVVFSQMIDNDISLIDFDDLGEIIYKQNTGFNSQENIVEKIMSVSSLLELDSFKQEIQSNYTKYFKESFQNFNFDKKRKLMFDIRNKVAHNNLFVKSDLDNAKSNEADLLKIIESAESNISSFKLSVEEQQSILQATIVTEKEFRMSNENCDEINLKIVGKIDLSELYETNNIISENELLDLIKNAEKSGFEKGYKFIGLKSFVTRYLPQKGYDSSYIRIYYSMINILKEKGALELYDIEDDVYNTVKAIKLIHPEHQS